MNSRAETLARAIAGLRAMQEEINAIAPGAVSVDVSIVATLTEAGTPAPSARRRKTRKSRAEA